MKSVFHIIASTNDEEIKQQILKALTHVQEDMEFDVKVHEHEPDPGAESGEYILSYYSGSHKKQRFYVGPPPGPGMKPQWSYKKKDAVKLSKNACAIIAERVRLMGYATPLEMSKGGPTLQVFTGGKATDADNVVQGPFANKVSLSDSENGDVICANCHAACDIDELDDNGNCSTCVDKGVYDD